LATDPSECTYPEENLDCNGNCIVDIDCLGECGGAALVDECGECVENGLCIDVDQDTICDCLDDCVGELDECGICDGPGLNEDGCCGNETNDCADVCGGDAVVDNCNICDSDPLNDCTEDCLGIFGGDATYDDCGVCDGNNQDLDCFGICFGDGTLDECGECGGDSSSCNAPIAFNQNLDTNEDSVLNFIFNSNDPNGDNLDVVIISNPIHGVLELNDNLVAIYTPDDNYYGQDNIIYKTTDGNWDSNQAQILITVNETYDPPFIVDIFIEVLEDDSILIDLGAFDTDSEDSNLVFSIIDEPDFGSLVEQRATASYLYTPNINYNGADEFIYEVTDGDNASQATVFITIINTNDAPTAEDFDFTELGTIDFSEFINDIDDDILSLNTIPPSAGNNLTTIFGNELVYSGVGYAYNYTSSGNFDVLLYKASDEVSQSNVATAIYNSGEEFSRIEPTPLSDEITMEEDNQIQISFFAFDYDGFLNGEPTIELTSSPTSGTLGQLSNPVISGFIAEWVATYIPNENYYGSDSISFSIIDDNGESSIEDGLISITINPVNDSPILSELLDISFDEDNTSESILLSANDVDGDMLTFDITEGINISSTLIGENLIFSAPTNFNGNETFTISVSDGILTDSKTINVTVNSINDPPELLIDLNIITFDEDTNFSLALYANDIDSDDLDFDITGGNQIVASFTESDVNFSPPENYNGNEEFTISVTDGSAIDFQNLSVNVTPVNDAPIIISTSPSEIDASIGYEYVVNAIDVDGDSLSFVLIGQPENMTINNNIISWEEISTNVSSVDFVLEVTDDSLSTFENINLSIIQFYDCNGTPNGDAVEDCTGECNGLAIVDECGECNGDNSSCTGCTNIAACNFDSEAIISDNSTCTFPEYLYNCNGDCINDTDGDSVCDELEISGCTDSAGLNYNPDATDDDGSCIFVGCTDESACNYDPNANADDDSCEYPEDYYDCNENCINDTDGDSVCDELEIYGCTDPYALNYNPDATEDDASCIYDEIECDSDPLTWIINPPSFEFNGSLTASVLVNGEQIGSEDDLLAGFVDDEVRGVISGLVFPPTGDIVYSLMLFSNEVSGEIVSFKYYHASSDQVFCLDETLEFTADMILGNAFSPIEFNIQEEFILGCTDQSACNYNQAANFDDGSCTYAEEYYDCSGNCLSDTDEDGVCDELDQCEGTLNIDSDGDGLCDDLDPCIGFDNDYDEDGDNVCDDYDPCFGFSNTDLDSDGICDDAEVLGCQDENACNYNAEATDAGDCIYAEDYYDCNENCLNDTDEDSVCDELEIIGCQEEDACNFNPSATDSDECTYPEENFDCDGNCILDIDCAGECGGDAVVDECGECNGDGPTFECVLLDGTIEFVCDQSACDLLDGDDAIPDYIYLSQNYPNPFNPTTQLEYTIPEYSNVNISLYDLNGKRIRTLLNTFHEPGYFYLSISSENLNSGVYIVQLITPSATVSRKITVIK